jgi:hypothetical protein
MAKDLTFTVFGEDPLAAAPPQFANFVAISHVASEVQFEFIYLDLNMLAQRFGQPGVNDRPENPELSKGSIELQGKTVAKIVVPVSSFLQLKGHLEEMLKKFEGALHERQHAEEEAGRERQYGGD